MLNAIMLLLLAPAPQTETPEPEASETSEAELSRAPREPAESEVIDPLQQPAAADNPSGLPPGVDLWDDSTWSDLTVEQKDELRAVRARRRAGGEEAPIELAEREEASAATPVVTSQRPEIPQPRRARGRSGRLQSYWEDKRLTLQRATIGFSVTWGASLVGSAVLIGVASRGAKQDGSDDMTFGSTESASASTSSSGTGLVVGAVVIGIAGAVGMVGTLVSASMLGAHNNAKPLYFGFGRDGLALRF